MTRRSYGQALKDARNDLKHLFRQREQLERRIARTRRTVMALQRMDGGKSRRAFMHELVERQPGLTQAVRYVMLGATHPIEPLGVRDELENVGYDIGSSPNVLNNVHTVLRRLVESGEVKQIGRKTMSKAPNLKGRYSSIGFWWGEYALPKGWQVYPDKRLRKRMATQAAKAIIAEEGGE